MSHEYEKLMQLPDDVLSAVGSEKIKEVLFIPTVETEGDPLSEPNDCPSCGSILDYNRGKYVAVVGDQRLLLIQDIMAYRCPDQYCKLFGKSQLFKTEVMDEVREKIHRSVYIES